MENLKLSKNLTELEAAELDLICGGSGIVFRAGRALHIAYCFLRDWAGSYEGDPYIRRKMGGL